MIPSQTSQQGSGTRSGGDGAIPLFHSCIHHRLICTLPCHFRLKERNLWPVRVRVRALVCRGETCSRSRPRVRKIHLTPRAVEARECKHWVGKDALRRRRVRPVHCSVIWPSAWTEDLNIMTLDMTERTCWLHSSGSALQARWLLSL